MDSIAPANGIIRNLSNMKKKIKRTASGAFREDGFWTAFLVILIVTLTLMGLGANVLLKGEGPNVTNHIASYRAEYAANAGAYFGVRSMAMGTFNESTVLSVGGVSVSFDTSKVAGTSNYEMKVNSSINSASRRITVQISANKLSDKGMWTTGDVYNIDGKDSTGAIDNANKVVSGADSVPTVLIATLNAMSTAQGHDQSAATFTPATGYPMTNFYKAGATPNVTHVLHNMDVQGSRTVYGIFVVEGNVTLNGGCRVEGVIYLPNVTSLIITGGGSPTTSTVVGGIISNGDLSATGSHVSVEHWPVYTRSFCSYLLNPNQVIFDLVKWEYR
jgi:hypothetical protein